MLKCKTQSWSELNTYNINIADTRTEQFWISGKQSYSILLPHGAGYHPSALHIVNITTYKNHFRWFGTNTSYALLVNKKTDNLYVL